MPTVCRVIGIIEEVLFHPYGCVLKGLLQNVVFPGLLRSNLKNDLRSWSCRADLPTSQMLVSYSLDYGNIRSKWVLVWIKRMIKVEIFIDGTALPTEQPGQN